MLFSKSMNASQKERRAAVVWHTSSMDVNFVRDTKDAT